MHYYSHHIGDFIRDTSRLNDAQCMAYLRLIWMYYEDEEPLIDNVELLAFKIGSDKDTVAMLLQCYFYANAMRWHHKRIDSELSMYKEKSEKARNSAKARWNNANAMRTHSECNANGMLTNNQEPITKNHNNAARGTRLTQEWIAPQEYIDFCNQERPDLDANQIALQFRDYWVSKAGKDGIKADWLATWRNWVRRQEKSKSKYKNKSDVVSDEQFDKWLNPQGENNARLG
jgi:uncharacterized protein YdaU (DUF1376 family)